MESTLRRLIEVYRREQRLYGEIREHVSRQRELIEAGASYGEINKELARKRDLLGEIEELERGIEADRALWRRRRHGLDGGQAAELMAILAEVTRLVEDIIGRERENEVLLTSRRRRSAKPVVSVRGATMRYARMSGAGVER